MKDLWPNHNGTMKATNESKLPSDLRGIDMRASLKGLKAFKPLENLPLTVAVRDKNYCTDPGIPGKVGAKLQQLERDANAALAATSSNGLLMVAMKSLYAPEDAPDLVIHAINQLLRPSFLAPECFEEDRPYALIQSVGPIFPRARGLKAPRRIQG